MIKIDKYDCIIIGSGFCGSVIARIIAERNKKVLVLERRNHIAGNMYDEKDSTGILVQRYGPHVFHTNNYEIFKFIKKYDVWKDYKLKCAVDINGITSPSPFNLKTIELLYKKEKANLLKKHLKLKFKNKRTISILELIKSNEKIIKEYGKLLFEKDYKPYTLKQWGLAPHELDISVLNRVPVRLDYIDYYHNKKYRALPKNGYTVFFKKLLNHKNINVKLNTDGLKFITVDSENKRILHYNKPINIPVVYTGAIDELLDYCYGHLPYRSLRFEYKTINIDSFQETPVMIHPMAAGFTRITEFKKMLAQNISGCTTIAYEYPVNADDKNELYYPVLTKKNIILYKKYCNKIKGISNLFLCGRLADYKYYNMDNAIKRAINVSKKLFNTGLQK